MGKIKKVVIHAGHNPKGKIACGASDYLDESTESRWVVKNVIKKLKKNKINVVDATCNNGISQIDVLRKICSKSNKEDNVDATISIHFNASSHEQLSNNKTLGTEVWLKSESGIRGILAERICFNIAKLGFTNRHVKKTDNLYFLNYTTSPAILVEVCFVTDRDDAELYKKKKNEVVDAIVDAILSV